MREIFRRFWPYARPYRRWIPVIVLLVALGSALEVAAIWMYKILVDEVLVPRDFGLLGWVALAYLGLTLLDGIISFADAYLSSWVGERFLVSLRTAFFRHLQSLSLGFFERRKLGDMISRLSEDIDDIEDLVLSGIVAGISYVFQLLFFVGALFYLQWNLALISLIAAPLFLLAARRFSRLIKETSREEQRRSGSISAVAEESFSNAALVQAYNRQEDEVERFHRENMGSFRAQMASTRLEALFSPLINLIELFGMAIVVAFGVWLLSQGQLTLGGLLVFLIYLTRLYEPVQGLSDLAGTIFEATAGAERVIEFLDQKPSVEDKPDAHPLRRAHGAIELDSATFRYPGAKRPALDDVSFSTGPGETLALVGPSGAGKSAVARLLLRFYDPSSGAVRLDGHDLRDLTLHSLRENVAVLLQETLVFDGTVRENIAYGRPNATEARDRPRRRGGRRPRVHRGLAGGLRHQGGTEGPVAVGGAAPADGDRAGDGEGRARPDPRRADDGPGRGVRGQGHGPPAPPDGGPHDDRDLPQPHHRARGRHRGRAGGGTDHRARHPSGASGPRRHLRQALPPAPFRVRRRKATRPVNPRLHLRDDPNLCCLWAMLFDFAIRAAPGGSPHFSRRTMRKGRG